MSIRKITQLIIRASLLLVALASTIFLTLILAGAIAANKRPALMPWHTVVLESEFSAADIDSIRSLDDYLKQEQILFEEMDSKIVFGQQHGNDDTLNRYSAGSRSDPAGNGENWNRSMESVPDDIRGGILLLHGMTDSPYTMRHLAKSLSQQGLYVLNLRMPGHGTAPTALARVDWKDWYAAIELGARHVRSRIAEDQPFYVLGYSNGGGLAVMYALDAIQREELPRVEQLFLISPMISVSGLASISRYYFWLGQLSWFEKSLWLDLFPEYDPHKYSSFPMNAARQSRAVTETLNDRLEAAVENGTVRQMPPVMTFQSLVDSTVSTSAVLERLYSRLPDNGSELVLFDVNRSSGIDNFLQPSYDALAKEFLHPVEQHYSRTLVTNVSAETAAVMAKQIIAGATSASETDIGLMWPQDYYSMSHVAMPFPITDEVYGRTPLQSGRNFPQLGRVNMIGETNALILPGNIQTRARSNPFYDYMVQRIIDAVETQ
jgi:alpha-beta hydrolase superfamily lysophospholipase